MFEINTLTEATLATLTPRIQKHGDEDVPAVSLGLELTVANTALDCIDPCIRDALFKRVDGQPELPGMEPSTPALRCNSFERVTLTTKHEGWTLEVDDKLDESKPQVFGGCKVDKFNVEPLNGGSCRLRFRVGTTDIDATSSGMLAMHVGQSIWIKLRAPEKADEAPKPEPKKSDANDLFVQGAGDKQPDAQPSGQQQEGGVWPFPNDPPASNVQVTKVSRKKLTGNLGTDADQARRQAEALAADPSQKIGPDGKAVQ